MNIKELAFSIIGMGSIITAVLIWNFLWAYIRKNKGQHYKPTMMIALLLFEASTDIVFFVLFFPYESVITFIQGTFLDSSFETIFDILFVTFVAVDIKIRHSIQKKKMAKGDPGFLKFYDLRNPEEKENPCSISTRVS